MIFDEFADRGLKGSVVCATFPPLNVMVVIAGSIALYNIMSCIYKCASKHMRIPFRHLAHHLQFGYTFGTLCIIF